MEDGARPVEDTEVTCAVCGTATGSPTLAWSRQTTARGAQWLCPGCTRANLRSIEGRLDEAW